MNIAKLSGAHPQLARPTAAIAVWQNEGCAPFDDLRKRSIVILEASRSREQ